MFPTCQLCYNSPVSQLRLTVLLLVVAVLTLQRRAEASAGTSGAAFLDIPVGAAPAALGGAYTALATDAYAPTWNPGGLGFVEATQIAGQHLSYLEGVRYEHASLVHSVGAGKALGISVQYLTSGDIAATDNGAQPLGTYSSHFAAYTLAYGQRLSDRLALGLAAKLIEAKLGDSTAKAWAGDIGTLYRPQDQLSLALRLSNVGSRLTFINDSDPLPWSFRLAAAYQLFAAWRLSAEGAFSRDQPAAGHFGIEWIPLSALHIRTGYRTDTLKELSALAGFSTGLGVQLWGQELSYAWVP